MKRLFVLVVLFGCLIGVAKGQNKRVTGVGTAKDDGLPLPGAGVKIKGAATGVFTATNGKYTISVPPGTVLVFSTIGFKTQELAVGNRDTVNVAMETESNMLGEVVVTQAYSVTAKGKPSGYARNYYAPAKSNKSIGTIRGNITSNYTPPQSSGTESYKGINENGFTRVKSEPLSTFSVDVDNASYTNVRRFINNGEL